MTESDFLTAGRYGYGQRRIYRDDLARVLDRILPVEDATTRQPVANPVAAEDLAAAAKICFHVAERFPGEHLGKVASTVGFRLRHPAIFGKPGQLVLYPALMLCREQQAQCAIEAPVSVAAVLEERSACRTASVLKTTISAHMRHTGQTLFDSEFVRPSHNVGISRG